MGSQKNQKRNLRAKSQSQSSTTATRHRSGATYFSQPGPSTSYPVSEPASRRSSRSQNVSADFAKNLEEQQELVNKLIRYLFLMDKDKQPITKGGIVKKVLEQQMKAFAPAIDSAKRILSEVFGYQLVEIESNKYILVNEIENKLPHIQPTELEARRQMLLFLVLVHVFMHQQCCSEESLQSFLTNIGIPYLDEHPDAYFGNVKHLINEVFVAQKYLDKTSTETDSSTKVEYKWGPRAEKELSKRTALNFVSQVYDGRAMTKWPLQYKAATKDHA